MTLLKILIPLLFCTSIFSQDSLVLCKKNNLSKEYKIPLGEYPIKVKPIGEKKFKAFLVGYKDSVLTFKAKPLSRKIRKQNRKRVRQFYRVFYDTIYSLKLKRDEFDSVVAKVNFMANEISYPESRTLKVDQLKKITIDNHYRPEKERLLKNLKIIGIITLPVAFAASATQSIYFIAPVYGLGLVLLVVDVIVETERLNFKKKWTVKTLIKNN